MRAMFRVFVISLAATSTLVADFSFDGFDEDDFPLFEFVAHARPRAGSIRLTPNEEGRHGALWFRDKQRVTAGFTVSFEFSVTGPYNSFGSADGMAFVIQNDSIESIGGGGGGNGYEGMPNCVAFELQHYSGEHVAIQSNGPGPNDPGGEFTIAQRDVNDINDGRTHRVDIEFEPPDRFIVRYDGRALIAARFDLAEQLILDEGRAWIGFTAGTGGAYANHDVHSWTFAGGATSDFVRGDTNADGTLNIGDPILTLRYLFTGAVVGCDDAADSNDDGQVDVTDAVGVLNFLFLGGFPPVAPSDRCGPDPGADELTCELYPPCP